MPYRAPADVDDFQRSTKFSEAELAQDWHNKVSGWVKEVIKELTRVDPAIVRIYDGAEDASTPIGIPWDGFPQFIFGYLGRTEAAQAAAEVLQTRVVGFTADRQPVKRHYRQQDEYCEWFTHRKNGKVTHIDFTCEGPEYWEFIGRDHDLLLHLYRKYVSEDVELDDLLWKHDVFVPGDDGPELRWSKDSYDPFNVWNTRKGAMHLTHWANTLRAEIHLAADASILRSLDGGQTVVNTVHGLACCSPFGDVNRSSDPNIGFKVNDLVRKGMMVALANPVGLYIATVNLDEIVDGDGNPAATLTVHRGETTTVDNKPVPRLLRVTVTVPTDRDVTVGGADPLQHGGQIAENIGMVLYGVGKPAPQGPPRALDPAQRCCAHPAHPDISWTIGPDENCSTVDWADVDSQIGPITEEPGDDAPELAAAGAAEAISLPVVVTTRVR